MSAVMYVEGLISTKMTYKIVKNNIIQLFPTANKVLSPACWPQTTTPVTTATAVTPIATTRSIRRRRQVTLKVDFSYFFDLIWPSSVRPHSVHLARHRKKTTFAAPTFVRKTVRKQLNMFEEQLQTLKEPRNCVR